VTSNEQSRIPPLYGLVLAGGKSLRMGYDKRAIQWHGKDQQYYMADLLKNMCNEVYISCRAEQQNEIDENYQTLADSYDGAGPIAGILSAFTAKREVAWLVVACDLPLMDLPTLQFLVNNRDSQSIATTFKSPFDGLPEPLITIWEPSAFEKLRAHLDGGYTCPRKALIKNEELVKMVVAPKPQTLLNANTPEDVDKVKEILATGE
jgi:molybdenum cofactor guanylyltransferase